MDRWADAAQPARSFPAAFPPGFRFHPTDEELLVYYLKNKVASRLVPAEVIADIDLYQYNPWELPSPCAGNLHFLWLFIAFRAFIFRNRCFRICFAEKAFFGEGEWYFFSPRNRKYPNGGRPNRAAGSGYWKATGIDKPILTSGGTKSIGVKKALVFHIGRPPKGMKTEWSMDEYRLIDATVRPPRSKRSMRVSGIIVIRNRGFHHSFELYFTMQSAPNPQIGMNYLSPDLKTVSIWCRCCILCRNRTPSVTCGQV